MLNRRFGFGFALVVCTGVLLCGCGGGTKDPNKLGAQHSALFASADPEAKALWDTAMAAMKTNGYAVTIEAIRAMTLQGKLTPEQKAAAQETAVAASDQMYDAANKGDASALAAIEELRKAGAR